MTTFEEIQAAWDAQSAQLNQATPLLTELAWRDRIRRIRMPLRGLIASLRVEIALCAMGMIVIGGFLAEHFTEPRFVWPAALMDLWFSATFIASIRQLLAASGVNYDEPIASAQGRLAGLRILRLKTFRWIFLTGQIVWWTPFAITALRMFFGIDAYRYITPAFLEINLLAGVALIPLLLLAAKRVPVLNRGRWYERLADLIAGHSLTEAQRQAKAFADFK